jgi:hypothetical protein
MISGILGNLETLLVSEQTAGLHTAATVQPKRLHPIHEVTRISGRDSKPNPLHRQRN